MHGLPTTAVLAATGGLPWVERVLDRLEREGAGVVLVKRCSDVADLLATAATGVAEAVLLPAYLDEVDGDVLARLASLGLAVVGLSPALDEHAERRLRQLGVMHVHATHEGGAALASRVRAAVAVEPDQPAVAFANPFAALPAATPVETEEEPEPGSGRVVAVWGPTGAPGRSTVAAGLAGELALLGWPTLLVDAEVYGGSLAPALGLPDEASGLAAACRAANRGELDTAALRALAVAVGPGLSLLSGLATAARWPELRPGAVQQVLDRARTLAAVTVVDCGFALEQDEELSYDTLAPRRNGATLAALEEADLVVVVGAADPVGLRRLVAGLGELTEVAPGARTSVVVNRLPSEADRPRVETLLRRFAGVEEVTCLPRDTASVDAALETGRLLQQAAPEGALTAALGAWASSLVTRPARRRAPALRRLLHR